MGFISNVLKTIQWKQLGFCLHHCPLCDSLRPIIKLDNSEIAVRCISCRSSAVTMSLAAVLFSLVQNLEHSDVYELSSRGPLHNRLKKKSRSLTSSEYYQHIQPGKYYKGVQCQDVQKLTYHDQSFDIVTSTEVFEHVPDDLKGFTEIFRVLRPGGLFVFTVPINNILHTVERAKLMPNGHIQHIFKPEYHIDPANDYQKTLIYRDYGHDIIQRLIKAGFDKAEIIQTETCIPWGFTRPVVVAQKRRNPLPYLPPFKQ